MDQELKIGDHIKVIGSGPKHTWHDSRGRTVSTGSILEVESWNGHSGYAHDVNTGQRCLIDTRQQFEIINKTVIKNKKESKLLNWIKS